MKVVGPYVTPVVSLGESQRGLSSKSIIGLYHKLHGVHRPVTMKKSIIKRRKESCYRSCQTKSIMISINPRLR